MSSDDYHRNCPRCNNELCYTTVSECRRATKSMSLCKSCSHIGKIFGDDTKQKLSLKLRGNTHTKGFRHSDKTREFLRNKTFSEVTREKLRKHRWNQIAKLGIKRSNYNPNACIFIDRVNECMGLNLQHALNGGEFKIAWYSVDGYDKENKVILEYDEPYHNSPSCKTRDLIRQTRIIKKIKPSLFLRYDEYRGRLYDAETNTTIPIYA